MPWTRTKKLMRKSRSIHRLIFPGSSRIEFPWISAVAVFAARFHRIVSGTRTSSVVSSDAIRARSASLSVAPLVLMAWICWRTIGFGGPISSVRATS